MKKLTFIISTVFVIFTTDQGFGQNTGNANPPPPPPSVNTSTTYGGVARDNGAGAPGKWTSNPPAGTNNTGFGTYVFSNGTTAQVAPIGTDNTAVGYESMFDVGGNLNNIHGSFNSTLGSQSLYNITTGSLNSVLGYQAMYNNTTGYANCATGYQAMFTNDAAWGNTADGHQALYSNAGGGAAANTAIGFRSLYCNSIGGGAAFQNTAVGGNSIYGDPVHGCGFDNTAEGYDALESNYANANVAIGYATMIHNTTGANNCAVGTTALATNVAGGANVAVGSSALQANTVSNLVAVGTNSLFHNTTGQENTAVGYQTLFTNTTGQNNTAHGYEALFNNKTGHENSALGDQALFHNTTGYQNCASGYEALNKNTVAWGNTADGYQALYSNVGTLATASGNTAIGGSALYFNTGTAGNLPGYQNTAVGNSCLEGNTLNGCGYNNAAVGYDALEVNYGTANAAIGAGALITNTTGSNNTASGFDALLNNTTGTNNSALGYNAGPPALYPALTYATAIGANAAVLTSHTIILGTTIPNSPNNIIDNVGIGMSGIPSGPQNRLEISYYGNVTPNPLGVAPFTSTFSPTGPGVATGSSGLQFRDLTAGSTQFPYAPNQGFLTVDDNGNVVYMASGGGSTPGLCSAPTPVPSPGSAYDLQTNSANFYFQGQGSGNADITNVIIGSPVGLCIPPAMLRPAKLQVLQRSGTSTGPSIGELVVNEDAPICTTGNNLQPNVMGIQSILPAINLTATSKVAGWFEADNSPNCCAAAGPQYAIYVPQNGGSVAIGYVWDATQSNNPPYQTCPSAYPLDVNGTISSTTALHISDSTLKTNVKSISGSDPLSIIKQLNGVSFNYIPSMVNDLGSAGTHYGFIAQKVERVLPNIVKTSNNGKKAVAYTEIIPWLVEGMKQQQQTIDNLHSTVDSLLNAFKSIQTCTNKLCANGTPTNSNDNLGGNNSTANAQEVTLSSANAPVLYQNTPNPFTTGTKINYYLPQGTVGATIVFYDSYGNQIKEVQLSQTGNGTLNITPDNLSNGMYSYSLIVNGNVIDTKRMVLQK
jgi:hypothetical protein